MRGSALGISEVPAVDAGVVFRKGDGGSTVSGRGASLLTSARDVRVTLALTLPLAACPAYVGKTSP